MPSNILTSQKLKGWVSILAHKVLLLLIIMLVINGNSVFANNNNDVNSKTANSNVDEILDNSVNQRGYDETTAIHSKDGGVIVFEDTTPSNSNQPRTPE